MQPGRLICAASAPRPPPGVQVLVFGQPGMLVGGGQSYRVQTVAMVRCGGQVDVLGQPSMWVGQPS